jgi:hypothetical protein
MLFWQWQFQYWLKAFGNKILILPPPLFMSKGGRSLDGDWNKNGASLSCRHFDVAFSLLISENLPPLVPSRERTG